MSSWISMPHLMDGFKHWVKNKDQVRVLRHFPVFLSFPITLAERAKDFSPPKRVTATGLLLPSPIGDEIGEGYTVFTILYTQGPLFCSSAEKIIIVDGAALPILEMWSIEEYPDFELTRDSLLDKGRVYGMLDDLELRLANLYAEFEFPGSDYPVLFLNRR